MHQQRLGAANSIRCIRQEMTTRGGDKCITHQKITIARYKKEPGPTSVSCFIAARISGIGGRLSSSPPGIEQISENKKRF